MAGAQPEDLVLATPDGLYCPAGGFHTDPWRPVAAADTLQTLEASIGEAQGRAANALPKQTLLASPM